MGLTSTDLTAIKQIVNDVVNDVVSKVVHEVVHDVVNVVVNEVVNDVVNRAVNNSEVRLQKFVKTEIQESEKRTDKKLEQLTLQIGQGFNEVHDRLDRLTKRTDAIEQQVIETNHDLKFQIKRIDTSEFAISHIRKKLHTA